MKYLVLLQLQNLIILEKVAEIVRNDLQFIVLKIENLNMNRETVRITLSSSMGLKNVCDRIISQNLIGK